MSNPTSFVFVEHVLCDPSEIWDEALDHLVSRFARAAAIDVDAIRAAGPLHAQLAALASWAEAANVDLDRELGRFMDEHLSMHVRPAPSITRAVRALAGTGSVRGVSALPARAAESIARHAGCFRSFEQLHGDVRDADALAALLADAPESKVYSEDPTPLPNGVERVSLLAASS